KESVGGVHGLLERPVWTAFWRIVPLGTTSVCQVLGRPIVPRRNPDSIFWSNIYNQSKPRTFSTRHVGAARQFSMRAVARPGRSGYRINNIFSPRLAARARRIACPAGALN